MTTETNHHLRQDNTKVTGGNWWRFVHYKAWQINWALTDWTRQRWAGHVVEIHTEFWWENLKERHNLIDLGVDWIRLTRILNKQNTREWIYLALDKLRVAVNMMISLLRQGNADNFFIGWEPTSFSGRTHCRTQIVYKLYAYSLFINNWRMLNTKCKVYITLKSLPCCLVTILSQARFPVQCTLSHQEVKITQPNSSNTNILHRYKSTVTELQRRLCGGYRCD